jgi:pyrimidine deaminase RibD-like protein
MPENHSQDDRWHAEQFLKLLDSWHPLRVAERTKLHTLARFEPADERTALARNLLAGLDEHGRAAARFVAAQSGSSESGLVLWWVQSQLADDFALDDASAVEFPRVRLIVDTALLQAEAACRNELGFTELAIEEARKSVGEDGRAHPKVGAVVVVDGNVLASAHRGELGKGEHAEYTALEKKLPEVAVAGATVYTTLEPCTTRNHPKIPCARRLIERKVTRVVIGQLDPNTAICGKGERLLRDHGIVVDRFPDDLIVQLEELNRDFVRAHSQATDNAAGR